MKINKKILSLPPYVSTHWHNISALHMSGTNLVVNFIDGDTVEIPGLGPDLIEQIFEVHAVVMEEELDDPHIAFDESVGDMSGSQGGGFQNSGNMMGIPFRIGFGDMQGLSSAMQHNPDQMHAPDLPTEVLEKIQGVMKVLAPDEALNVPKPEPHCNCVHCQIARAIHDETDSLEFTPVELELNEEVTDSDLQFCQWKIEQEGENLFSVMNKLDSDEKFSVYLGHPVGCTCGKDGCEHILAVLKS